MENPKNSRLPLLHSVSLQNILSFGTSIESLSLSGLNVLIGTNGSGKSNFIDIISLLRATTSDIPTLISKGGGINEWRWKGGKELPINFTFHVNHPDLSLSHQVSFQVNGNRIKIDKEYINLSIEFVESPIDFLYHFDSKTNENSALIISFYLLEDGSGYAYTPPNTQVRVSNENSVLSQIRDPEKYGYLAYLTDTYKQIRIYREWTFGRNTIFRQPQRADLPNNWLEEDFSNLGLFLSKLKRNPQAKRAILDGLNSLYAGITDFDLLIEGGTVQVFFTEGEFTIPATRLSDGTLRYLCLLAILNDPTPPPLVCIEEPELGLHPDVLPKLAELLKDASTRMQLIVTTHSDILIDALSDTPESVVVCEKHEGQTTMKRLNANELSVWLDKYRLGQLWLRGEIGGNRW
ncbi:MAG: AAA family ATPase [Bacteroidia bacterium]|jgi:predicted ATPase|nr:AAA family ATPase [Bacteroidia bacterium]